MNFHKSRSTVCRISIRTQQQRNVIMRFVLNPELNLDEWIERLFWQSRKVLVHFKLQHISAFNFTIDFCKIASSSILVGHSWTRVWQTPHSLDELMQRNFHIVSGTSAWYIQNVSRQRQVLFVWVTLRHRNWFDADELNLWDTNIYSRWVVV